MIEVELPDGSIAEFPDGTPQETIKAAISKRFAKPQAPETSILEDVVRGAADMATFGLADEFAAKMGELTGIGGQKGQYEQNLATQRQMDKQANPYARAGGQVAGGIATAGLLPLAGGLYRGGNFVGNMMRGGAVGAGEGAAYGFGSGEGGMDRAKGAAIGAPLGAVGGAIANPLTQAAGSLLQVAKRSFSGGMSRAQQRAVRKLERALAADEISMEDAVARVRLMGERDIMPDIMGQNVKGLAAGAASRPGPTKTKAYDFLTDRALKQSDEVGKIVAKTLESGDAGQTTLETIARRQKEALKNYAVAEAKGQTPEVVARLAADPKLKSFLAEPEIKSALAKTKRLFYDEIGELPDTDFRVLDKLHKELVSRGGVAKRAGESPEASQAAFGNMRSRLREIMKENGIPEYGEAVSSWAGDSAALRAIQSGKRIFSQEDFLTKGQLEKLTPSEREMYLLGASSAIIEKAMQATGSGSAAKRVLRSESVKKRLRPLFKNDDQWREFETGIDKLANQSETAARVNPMSGSKTAMTQAEMAEAGDLNRMVRDLFLFQSPSMAIGFEGARRGADALARFSGLDNPALGDILFTPGRQANEGVLKEVLNQRLAQQVRGLAGGSAAKSAGVAAGNPDEIFRQIIEAITPVESSQKSDPVPEPLRITIRPRKEEK